MRSTPGVRMPPLTAPPSAPRRSASSGVSPAAVSSIPSASCGREAEPEQTLARERARDRRWACDARRSRRCTLPATFSRSSTMIRSAVRLPMPGTAWKRAVSPEAIAFSSSRGSAAREHGQRHLGADRLHADQHQEQLALGLAGEAEQVHGVVAQRRGGRTARACSPAAGTERERLRGDGELVADAGGLDDDLAAEPATAPRRARRRSRAEPCHASASCSGAPLAWQMATASASAA